jgi:D-beta-D-heptose 7-phosphate kinase/D-beta-D-heptose 1-phosphate adenosyltransferase
MFERMIKRFSGVRILVVGDIMLDRFIWGDVSRISPEAPVPVVVVERETFLLGGAANVVNNILSLGGQASLCGVVGDDEMGQNVVQRLDDMGVDRSGVFVEPGRQTTVKTRIIAHHQQLVRIDRETTRPPKVSTRRSLSGYLKQKTNGFDGIILSDYGKGLLTRNLARDIIRKARETGKFVMVDPKIRNFFFYRGATVVTPNTAEASFAARISITDETSLNRAGRVLLKRLKCDALVVTRGEDGMAIFEPHQKPLLVPTEAREVYDVTGAGDTVIGTMALALGAGASIRRAAELANHAAGIVVGKVGTATVGQAELTNAMKERFR